MAKQKVVMVLIPVGLATKKQIVKLAETTGRSQRQMGKILLEKATTRMLADVAMEKKKARVIERLAKKVMADGA